ncbi:MAG: hypothetical protein QXO03_04510 [Thermoplasmatales archaeon]
MPKATFFLLVLVIMVMTAGAGYLTGISVRRFALDTRDHFLSLFRMITDFFEVF